MKKATILSTFLAALVLLTVSCKKDKETDEHNDTADIQIAAPVADHEYAAGDSVLINATITGKAAMHGWELHIRKTADQSEVFSDEAHDHAAIYTISKYWINNVTVHTMMELEIIATIDHDGHTASKKVAFHCNP